MKGVDTMTNKTPLRLITTTESPPEEDESGGAPVVSISDEQAITRKVPESAMIAAHEDFSEKPHPGNRWHRLLPAAVVAVIVVVLVVALASTGKKSTARIVAPAATVARPVATPPPPQAAVAAPIPAAVQPPAAKEAPTTIHVQITAEPVEAELSLDGNVVAGHRLNLEVPRDRGIHVVSASAPGYIPFNQQVAFSNDVVLAINLHRGRTPAVHAPTRSRSVQPEPRQRSESKPPAASTASRVEPGMSLEGPALRPTAKPIDERNPYKP